MQTKTDQLFDAVKKTIDDHYPAGWGGAGGVLLENGDILTSISPEFPNAASSVCMELGSYIQAATLRQQVTHTLCLVRENEHDSLTVLTPCGICQERLDFWGKTTQCGIDLLPDGEIHYIPLADLQPFHWSGVYQ